MKMMENNGVTIVRDEPISERNTKIPTHPVPADELRKIYFNKAAFFVKKLQRSVCKEYDPNPSPAAFQAEVACQSDIMKEILFLQRCRAAIEQAVADGRGEAKGEKSSTTFIRKESGLIQVVSGT